MKDREKMSVLGKIYEEMMPYGFAAVIFLSVMLTLYFLGVFSHKFWISTEAVGFEPFLIVPGSMKLNSTGLYFTLKNEAGGEVNIIEINGHYKGKSGGNVSHDHISGFPFYMGPNGKARIFISSEKWNITEGEPYNVSIEIVFEYVERGEKGVVEGFLVGLTS